MKNIYPALAQSVFILLLADFATLCEIPMCLDTPHRLVRGSPATRLYRYGFLLASRLVPVHRDGVSLAPIAPLVSDGVMAVLRAATSSA